MLHKYCPSYCSELQWVAVSCSELQCVAASCSELQRVAVSCSELQWVAVSSSELQWVPVSCSVNFFGYCTNTCMYVFLSLLTSRKYVYVYMCVCVYVCMCICVSLSICVYVYMCVSLFLCCFDNLPVLQVCGGAIYLSLLKDASCSNTIKFYIWFSLHMSG